MLQAWGDESGSVASRDPGTYLLGAVIVAVDRLDDLRAAMRAVPRRGGSKLHWSSDDDAGRRRTLMAALEVDLEAFVVVRAGSVMERNERRRRKCMETFAPALESVGCATLTMESRGPSDDRRDRLCFDAMRARRVLSAGGLRIEHVPGPAEPALWLADAVCGAVVAYRLGDDRWIRLIDKRATIELIGGAM